MAVGLAALLLDWGKKCLYNQETDYVFASAEKHGCGRAQQWQAHSACCEEGWDREACSLARFHTHVFRRALATLLKGNAEDVKTAQETLRHADGKVTLDTETQGLMPVKREAQRKVIAMIGSVWTHAS